MTATDYTPAAGTLTFAAGETSKSFTVFVNNDSIRESTESFNIRLSSPSNAALGSTALTTVNIADDDKRRGGPIRGGASLQNKRIMMDISRNRVVDPLRVEHEMIC